MEGYILSLYALSQLYCASGNNYAAKYYAMCGIWQSTQNEELYKRISDGYGLILQYDFEQGAWINCLEVFRLYINSRINFKDSDLEASTDDLLTKSFTTIAAVLSVMPRINLKCKSICEKTIKEMGILYKQHIEHLKEKTDELVPDDKIEDFIKRKCIDSVINDAGDKRQIQWKALGSTWSIVFQNNWIETSLGEEVAATLQIILTQFALAKNDIHFLKGDVIITVVNTSKQREPEQLASNSKYAWKIYSKKVVEAKAETVKLQVTYITISLKLILDNLSLLPENDFDLEFTHFFEEEDLAGTTFSGHLYQRLYRNLFAEKAFNRTNRTKLAHHKITPVLPEHKALSWDGSLSSKYSEARSIELIRGRYENMINQVQLTIKHIKKDDRYIKFVEDLRKNGWLDWQIVLAMYNHILSFKANQQIKIEDFETESEFAEAFNNIVWELGKIDEKDNYVQFDLDFFINDDFDFQLNNVFMVVLNRWDLENKSSFPNFAPIRELLNKRFNFNRDEFIEDSPL